MPEAKRATGRPVYHYAGCIKLEQTNKPIKTYSEAYAAQFWELCDVCAGEWAEKNRKAAKTGVAGP